MTAINRGMSEDTYLKRYPWTGITCITCKKVFSWKYRGKKRTDKKCSECIEKERQDAFDKREKRKEATKNKPRKSDKNMKIVTINLNEHSIKALEVLQDMGLYPSRSEAIRVAIRDFLQSELGIVNVLDENDVNVPETRGTRELTGEERKKEISRLITKLERERRVETALMY